MKLTLIIILLGFHEVSSFGAYLSQRGPAPLRWRALPSITSTNAALAGAVGTSNSTHNAAGSVAVQPTGNPAENHDVHAGTTPESPDFVGPVQPPAPVASAPAPVPTPDASLSHDPAEVGSGTHAAPLPNTFVSPTEPSHITIGTPDSKPVINAQMLVRFFQNSTPVPTNALWDASAAAAAHAQGHQHTHGAGPQTSILIPVQFMPPEPYTRPASSGSSATYTVTPKP